MCVDFLFAWHVYHVEGSLSFCGSLVLPVDQVLTPLQRRMYSYLHVNHDSDNLSIISSTGRKRYEINPLHLVRLLSSSQFKHAHTKENEMSLLEFKRSDPLNSN